jgi:predicted nucleic acid-binding protein
VKCVLDTNVYLYAMNSEAGAELFLQRFTPLVFCTTLCSVVAQELYAGAVDAKAMRLVEKYIGSLERTGRLVAPTFADWKEAGKLIALLAHKEPSRRSKLQQLLNDVLIALCARRIGATVFTSNREDFELIRRYRAFALKVLVPGER